MQHSLLLSLCSFFFIFILLWSHFFLLISLANKIFGNSLTYNRHRKKCLHEINLLFLRSYFIKSLPMIWSGRPHTDPILTQLISQSSTGNFIKIISSQDHIIFFPFSFQIFTQVSTFKQNITLFKMLPLDLFTFINGFRMNINSFYDRTCHTFLFEDLRYQEREVPMTSPNIEYSHIVFPGWRESIDHDRMSKYISHTLPFWYRTRSIKIDSCSWCKYLSIHTKPSSILLLARYKLCLPQALNELVMILTSNIDRKRHSSQQRRWYSFV